MKLKTVSAAHGFQWVQQGCSTFFKHPIAFAALLASLILAALLLALVPVIGSLLILAALPWASLVFMLASNAVMAKTTPTLHVLVQPFRVDAHVTKALIWLGGIYAAVNVCTMLLADAVDGGQLRAVMQMLPTAKPEELATKISESSLISSLLLRTGLSMAVSVPFWHAPALIYWEKHSCAQALFSSTLACARNWSAFLVYGLAFFGLTAAISLACNLVFVLLGQTQLFFSAAAPISLLLVTIFYISFYFTFVGCFAPDQT
jgi:hypothetical protein